MYFLMVNKYWIVIVLAITFTLLVSTKIGLQEFETFYRQLINYS